MSGHAEPEDETTSHYGPECPYCGKVDYPEDSFFYDEKQFTDHECPACGEKYAVAVEHVTWWTCTPIEQKPETP